MKILRKTIKWLIDLDEKGSLVEIETTEDGREWLYVKPLTRPVGLVFYLDRFEIKYESAM